MLRKGGRDVPRTAAQAPLHPASALPATKERFVAMGPGTAVASTIMSAISSSVNSPMARTSDSMTPSMTMPPPMVKAPILKKRTKMDHKRRMKDRAPFERKGGKIPSL